MLHLINGAEINVYKNLRDSVNQRGIRVNFKKRQVPIIR